VGQAYRTFAIVMNAPTWQQATKVDYFITNIRLENLTTEWVVSTYTQRKWVEVFLPRCHTVVGVERRPSSNSKKLTSAFCFRILRLYFDSLAEVNWGLTKALGQATLKNFC
jgi:hypothetical protein